MVFTTSQYWDLVVRRDDVEDVITRNYMTFFFCITSMASLQHIHMENPVLYGVVTL